MDALLLACLTLTYNAIHYAQENGINNRRGMKEFYRTLRRVELPSCYKVALIGRACSISESRKKTEKRNRKAKHSKPLKPVVCLISGFFTTARGRLFIPLSKRNQYADVLLNRHVRRTIEGKALRSLTITPGSLSICYSEDVVPIPARTVYGVDRNEKNLTFGNEKNVIQIVMSKTVKVRQTTRKIVGSFKRNDVRMRRKLASKYWRRATNRTDQMLHGATSFIVESAVHGSAALALEDLTDIRKMYRRGNGQGTDYRFRLNSWPHGKAHYMLDYKAVWNGVTMISLTKADTRGSTTECASCGERLHSPAKGDAKHGRMLWCQSCKAWMERDANAAINLSKRGLVRFASSLPQSQSRSQESNLAEDKGLAVEALKGNGTTTPILRVDASKLARCGPRADSL